MNKVEDFINATKLNDLLNKKEDLINMTKLNELLNKKEAEEKKTSKVVWIFAIIGIIAAVAAAERAGDSSSPTGGNCALSPISKSRSLNVFPETLGREKRVYSIIKSMEE